MPSSVVFASLSLALLLPAAALCQDDCTGMPPLVSPPPDTLTIPDIPDWRPGARPVRGGSVSAEQLRNPLNRQARKTLEKVRQDLASPDPAKRDLAQQGLQAALEDRAMAPYAHALMGTEYLRQGDAAQAAEELGIAAKVLADNVGVHSNLGYALHSLGRNREAEVEVRRALELDKKDPRIRYLLATVLLAQDFGSQEGLRNEALKNLKLASKKLPGAKADLEQFYAQNGGAGKGSSRPGKR